MFPIGFSWFRLNDASAAWKPSIPFRVPKLFVRLNELPIQCRLEDREDIRFQDLPVGSEAGSKIDTWITVQIESGPREGGIEDHMRVERFVARVTSDDPNEVSIVRERAVEFTHSAVGDVARISKPSTLLLKEGMILLVELICEDVIGPTYDPF